MTGIISLDNIQISPMYEALFITHRAGCASTRGRDCTCEYLAQWDPQPRLSGRGILVMPEGWEGSIDYQQDARMPIIMSNGTGQPDA